MELEGIDDRPPVHQLLASIKQRLPELEQIFAECSDHWGYEDPVYRFYYGSLKAYRIQATTERIAGVLGGLLPDHALDESFRRIISDGTGHVFDVSHNRNWLDHTRPIVEAFFHARYFLEMAIRYGRKLDHPPRVLPSGWAALLCLYGLR